MQMMFKFFANPRWRLSVCLCVCQRRVSSSCDWYQLEREFLRCLKAHQQYAQRQRHAGMSHTTAPYGYCHVYNNRPTERVCDSDSMLILHACVVCYLCVCIQGCGAGGWHAGV